MKPAELRNKIKELEQQIREGFESYTKVLETHKNILA